MSRINSVVHFTGGNLAGVRENDANIRFDGIREDRYGIRMGGVLSDRYGVRMNGLREEDAGIALSGLREDDARINMNGLREEDAGIALSGLREEAAGINLMQGTFLGELEHDSLGRTQIRKIQNPVLYRETKLRGSRYGGHGHHNPRVVGVKTAKAGVGGIFDFLSSEPSFEEYQGQLRTIINSWTPVRNRIDALPAEKRSAVIATMEKMGSTTSDYNNMSLYLQDGPPGQTPGRVKRIQRCQTALPSIEKLVSQMESTGQGPTQGPIPFVGPKQGGTTQQHEQNQALAIVKKDLANRDSELANPIPWNTIALVGGVGAAAGGLLWIASKFMKG